MPGPQHAMHVSQFYGDQYFSFVRAEDARCAAATLARQKCLKWALRCGAKLDFGL